MNGIIALFNISAVFRIKINYIFILFPPPPRKYIILGLYNLMERSTFKVRKHIDSNRTRKLAWKTKMLVYHIFIFKMPNEFCRFKLTSQLYAAYKTNNLDF